MLCDSMFFAGEGNVICGLEAELDLVQLCWVLSLPMLFLLKFLFLVWGSHLGGTSNYLREADRLGWELQGLRSITKDG